jgi:predicted signal transduction protein with EAL and GGDEF domain
VLVHQPSDRDRAPEIAGAVLAVISRMGGDEFGLVLSRVRSVGHDLGMAIVAEGVEDEETFALLNELQCDAVQGYLIHRPAEAEVLADWLRDVPKREPDGRPSPLLAAPFGDSVRAGA